MRTTLQPLRNMLDQSASSLTAPNVLHQVRQGTRRMFASTCSCQTTHNVSLLYAAAQLAWHVTTTSRGRWLTLHTQSTCLPRSGRKPDGSQQQTVRTYTDCAGLTVVLFWV
jgi:hypothetical protein